MNTITAGEMVGFGWETFKKRPWFLIGATALYFLSGLVLNKISEKFGSHWDEAGVAQMHNTIATHLVLIIVLLLGSLIGLIITRFLLSAHDSVDTVDLIDLRDINSFWKYAVTNIFVAVLTAVGFILLVVPGIIALLMFMFSKFIVVDRHLGPIEAMKESARITHGNRVTLLVFVLAIIGINILGALCVGVGLLVSIPVTMLAVAHAYRTLSGAASVPVATPAPVATPITPAAPMV